VKVRTVPLYSKRSALVDTIRRRLDGGTYQPVAPEGDLLGEVELACGDEPLFVTRDRETWCQRGGVFFLTRDPRRIGLWLLAAGRPLVFASDADAAWARRCIDSVTPRPPRLLVERPIARAA